MHLFKNNDKDKDKDKDDDEDNDEDEEWKPINGFDNYKASNKGAIKNIKTGRILKCSLCRSRYRINLANNEGEIKGKYIAYVIAELFIENPENYKYVAHIDNDESNNKSTNLKWVMYSFENDNKEDEDEEWKPIDGFDIYRASNRGEIKNIKTGRMLKGSLHHVGYSVFLTNNEGKIKERNVAHLIAELFIENPKNYRYVVHIDNDKSNNKSTNLKWVMHLFKNKDKDKDEDEDEEWKVISYADNYEVSKKGNVRDIGTKYPIKFSKKGGYYVCHLTNKGKGKENKVHKLLVADAFIENPENKKELWIIWIATHLIIMLKIYVGLR